MRPTEIATLHKKSTEVWHVELPNEVSDGLAGLIESNHLQNFLLWHEEDVARRDDLGAERIRQAKRTIDQCNQKRNDLVEKIDKHLVEQLRPAESGCLFNSETPGMIIDRLSILALKEFHMAEETGRADADEHHREKCARKLSVIKVQIGDLSTALGELLDGVRNRTRSFRAYYQFKMYNDSDLNPELRRAS
ncbi:MAG: DUF4254 domain-containing protein [Planctomycetales bacterium]|jgi:hypothetical protein